MDAASAEDFCIACGTRLPERVLICPSCGALNTRRSHGASYTKTMRFPMSTLIVHGDAPEAFVENVGHYLRAGQRVILTKDRWIAGGVFGNVLLSIFVVVCVYAFLVTASPVLAVFSVFFGGFLAFSIYVLWWSLTPPRPTETQERIPSLRP
jgi:phage shock protein PspC (stress-responsive transcriptional regulator)